MEVTLLKGQLNIHTNTPKNPHKKKKRKEEKLKRRERKYEEIDGSWSNQRNERSSVRGTKGYTKR